MKSLTRFRARNLPYINVLPALELRYYGLILTVQRPTLKDEHVRENTDRARRKRCRVGSASLAASYAVARQTNERVLQREVGRERPPRGTRVKDARERSKPGGSPRSHTRT